jgi:hypothetical protein
MFYTLLEPSGSTSQVPSNIITTIYFGNDNWWNGIAMGAITNTGAGAVTFTITLSARGNYPTSATKQTTINYNISNTTPDRYGIPTFPKGISGTISVPSGYSNSTYPVSIYYPPGFTNWQTGDTVSISVSSEFTTEAGGTTNQTTYITSITDPYNNNNVSGGNNWYAIDQNSIKLSLSQSIYYSNFVFSASYNESGYGMDTPIFALSASQMDLIRLYNQTGRWTNKSEYRIQSVTTLQDSTGSFVVLNLDRSIDPADTDYGTIPSKISKYMLLRRLPDETNVILNYDLGTPITQDGLLFPQYIEDNVKNNSGNVVKALKQQNLITNQNQIIFQ